MAWQGNSTAHNLGTTPGSVEVTRKAATTFSLGPRVRWPYPKLVLNYHCPSERPHKMTKKIPTAICIVVENLPVPLDRRVWREACALRDAGYRVSVICPKGKGFSAAYETLDGVEIYRHRAFEASSVLGYLLEYSWALVAEFLLTLKVFARTKFRILQACNPPDTIFLIGLLLKPFGVRFIFDQHDLGPELFEAKFGKRRGLFYSLARFLERCSFRVADISIATNESFKDRRHPGRQGPKRCFRRTELS